VRARLVELRAGSDAREAGARRAPRDRAPQRPVDGRGDDADGHVSAFLRDSSLVVETLGDVIADSVARQLDALGCRAARSSSSSLSSSAADKQTQVNSALHPSVVA